MVRVTKKSRLGFVHDFRNQASNKWYVSPPRGVKQVDGAVWIVAQEEFDRNRVGNAGLQIVDLRFADLSIQQRPPRLGVARQDRG